MRLIAASTENKVLFLVGPTAVGKTEISFHLAEKLGGEIISSDSRQIYRYMDIGTAKPSLQERQFVPHHFIDIRNPDQYYSAGEYGREARCFIDRLQMKGKQPIVVGGSGFYIRALVDGLFAPKISDSEVKARWYQFIAEKSLDEVYSLLQQIDPVTAARLHPHDTQRIVRALEVYEISGQPISSFSKGGEEAADFYPIFFGLSRPRDILYHRIDNRVDAMVSAGLIDEVKGLLEMGYSQDLNALRTVGYQETAEYLDGAISLAKMVHLIKLHSRHYAKRQMTWFRRDNRIQWIDLEEISTANVVEKICALFQQQIGN